MGRKGRDFCLFSAAYPDFRSNDVGGTENTESAPIQDVAVNHGCVHVSVAEQFLNGSYVVTTFQKLCGEAFVLGHALYMKAVHGGKAKNDRIDAHKIAVMLRGGMIPTAYVYPAGMLRPTPVEPQ